MQLWRWLWPNDAPTWHGLKLREIRAAAGALFIFCLASGVNDSSNGHSHHMLTYVLWYGLGAALLLVVILTTTVIVRRRPTTPTGLSLPRAEGGRPATPPPGGSSGGTGGDGSIGGGAGGAAPAGSGAGGGQGGGGYDATIDPNGTVTLKPVPGGVGGDGGGEDGGQGGGKK